MPPAQPLPDALLCQAEGWHGKGAGLCLTWRAAGEATAARGESLAGGTCTAASTLPGRQGKSTSPSRAPREAQRSPESSHGPWAPHLNIRALLPP